MSTTNILEENSNFTLSDEVNGPLISVAVGIELILALSINLFALVFTLFHPQTLKQPSIVFLTNFVLANLVTAIFVMPFTVIAAATGEWIFGRTPKEKDITCKCVSFVFTLAIQETAVTLALISIDRFLFIVKPLVYKRFMKTWLAISVVVLLWMFGCLLNIISFAALGQHAFEKHAATCFRVRERHNLIVSSILILVIFGTITLTTVWTFCFTRTFIEHINSRDHSLDFTGENHVQKHLYMSRVKSKVFGIFGVLLVLTTVSFMPAFVTNFLGTILGIGALPGPLIAVSIISFLVNTAVNPMVQVYFRKDMNDFVLSYWFRIKKKCCSMKHSEEEESTTANDQTTDVSVMMDKSHVKIHATNFNIHY